MDAVHRNRFESFGFFDAKKRKKSGMTSGLGKYLENIDTTGYKQIFMIFSTNFQQTRLVNPDHLFSFCKRFYYQRNTMVSNFAYLTTPNFYYIRTTPSESENALTCIHHISLAPIQQTHCPPSWSRSSPADQGPGENRFGHPYSREIPGGP